MPQELTTENAVLTGGKVKPQDDVTIYGTDVSSFLETGKPYVVHSALAEKLIKQGKATKTGPKKDKEGGNKDEK